MDIVFIIACIVVYLLLGALFFLLAWKGLEENTNIKLKKRKVRITIRVLAILTWPLSTVLLVFVLFFASLAGLYEEITK